MQAEDEWWTLGHRYRRRRAERGRVSGSGRTAYTTAAMKMNQLSASNLAMLASVMLSATNDTIISRGHRRATPVGEIPPRMCEAEREYQHEGAGADPSGIEQQLQKTVVGVKRRPIE